MAEVGSEEDIRSQWTTFLDQPGGRAALLQAGLTLLQPPSFGDTSLSQIGRAIGAGGEAVGRQEEMGRKQMEAESKAQARESAANLAEARARTTGLASQIASEREANRMTLGRLSASNQLYGMYNRHRDTIAKANEKRAADIVKPQPPLPIPSFEEFIANDPAARDIATRAGIPMGGAPAAARPALSSQDQDALDWANQNPGDPRADEIKRRLGQ